MSATEDPAIRDITNVSTPMEATNVHRTNARKDISNRMETGKRWNIEIPACKLKAQIKAITFWAEVRLPSAVAIDLFQLCCKGMCFKK